MTIENADRVAGAYEHYACPHGHLFALVPVEGCDVRCAACGTTTVFLREPSDEHLLAEGFTGEMRAVRGGSEVIEAGDLETVQEFEDALDVVGREGVVVQRRMHGPWRDIDTGR